MSARGAALRPVISIAFEIPPLNENAFLFRREFLAAIRGAISSAQIAGRIDVDLAVACFRALPIAEPTSK